MHPQPALARGNPHHDRASIHNVVLFSHEITLRPTRSPVMAYVPLEDDELLRQHRHYCVSILKRMNAANSWLTKFDQVDDVTKPYLAPLCTDLRQHVKNMRRVSKILEDCASYPQQFIANEMGHLIQKHTEIGRVAGPLMYGLRAVGDVWDSGVESDGESQAADWRLEMDRLTEE